MKLSVHASADEAIAGAADRLAGWLTETKTRNVMVAGGNSPLPIYRLVAERHLPLAHLDIFMLDEYVGVPLDEPRNCANLLRRTVADAWGVPRSRFHALSSLEPEALDSVREHEHKIESAGGLDVVVLGLGVNGHLGFNEPGSAEDSTGRLAQLAPLSVEANRLWFGGDYAPAVGVTVGLRTILAARHVLLIACGAHKRAAVRAMVTGPRSAACPASFLQTHADARVFVDAAASAALSGATA